VDADPLAVSRHGTVPLKKGSKDPITPLDALLSYLGDPSNWSLAEFQKLATQNPSHHGR